MREVDFIPITHIQPIKNEKENLEEKNPSQKPPKLDSQEKLEQSRKATFLPQQINSLRGEKEVPDDDEVRVWESDEVDSTNDDEADKKFGVKGTSVLKVEGKEMSLDDFENSLKKQGEGEPKNPVAERGKFEELQIDDKKNEHQIRKEVMKRTNHDSQEKNDSQEVDKGHMVSQELLERGGEGGTDYNENQIESKEETTGNNGYQIEKKVMNRPGYIEVPRVIPHQSLNIHLISGT